MQGWITGPRASLGLTEAEVQEALSYNRGARVRHEVQVLDLDDQPTGETLPIDRQSGGSVTWTYRPSDAAGQVSTDTVAVRRRANITMKGPVAVNVLARRFRVVSYFTALNGVEIPFYLGVFRATLPERVDDGIVVTQSLDLTDKSGLWLETTTNEPVNISASENVVTHVRNDLSTIFGEAAAGFPTPPTTTLQAPLFIEEDTPYLVKWNRMFQAIGLSQVIAEENGRPRAYLLTDLANKGSEHLYGPGAGKILRAGSVGSLIPDLPNVLKFTSRRGPTLPELGNGITIRKNQSEGPGSIDERGEEVQRSIITEAYDQAELEAIADSESQRYFAGGGDRYTGQVALNPRHSDQDVVTLDRARLGLAGLFNVTSWTYPLMEITSESAVLMSITAERRVLPTVVNS